MAYHNPAYACPPNLSPFIPNSTIRATYYVYFYHQSNIWNEAIPLQIERLVTCINMRFNDLISFSDRNLTTFNTHYHILIETIVIWARLLHFKDHNFNNAWSTIHELILRMNALIRPHIRPRTKFQIYTEEDIRNIYRFYSPSNAKDPSVLATLQYLKTH